MAKRQFTVTVDRSGQRVVKEYSKGRRLKGPVLSRTKRSNADRSVNYDGRRVKSDVSTSGYRHNRIDDSGIGPNDLRVKLTQKRISREEKLKIAERKKKELYEKVSRAIRSAECQEENHLRNTCSPRRADAPPPLQTDTIRTYDPQTTFNGARTRSPDRVMRYAGGVSDPRSVELPLVNSLQPLTVTSLLHSLGLGKYVINFQAEEIDMLALRQMGERDLKDLGIPMGPRKKILLAVEQQTKRLVTQARSNYMQ